TPAQLAGLTLTAGDDDGATITLSVTANASEGGTTAHSATQTISIAETGVPEAPVLTAANVTAAAASVNEGGTVGLSIAPSFEADADAANTVTIAGVPAGATLSAGTNGGGGGGALTPGPPARPPPPPGGAAPRP